MQQFTFDADKLAALASGQSGKNVLMTVDKSGIKASIVSKPGSASLMDAVTDPATLDGCPYPPGCN